MSTIALFDSLAARYDELWTETAIGRAQRNQVWRVIDPLFGAGDHILDIGCGTGEDAAHFTSRGVCVQAIDASPAMVAIARKRGGFAVQQTSAENLAALDLAGPLDGAISNFGALNCVKDLPALARELGRRIRPGGHVAICTMGRFCAWETLYYAARLNFRKAFRRWHAESLPHETSQPVAQPVLHQVLHPVAFPTSQPGQHLVAQPAPHKASQPAAPTVAHQHAQSPHVPLWGRWFRLPSSRAENTIHYPTIRQLRAAFAPDFELQHWTGIGMLVPPSYVKLPAAAVNLLAWLDRVPFLRAMGDHRLLVFIRK